MVCLERKKYTGKKERNVPVRFRVRFKVRERIMVRVREMLSLV